MDLISAERAVPRYTSYPTAPHFAATVGPASYGGWLENLADPATLSLYLHVPFCEQLCHYCGCNTKAVRRPEPVQTYARALGEEVDLVAARTARLRIAHLHWGGGTPSMLGGDGLRTLVAQLDARFDLGALREHAIELDPRHVTRDLVTALSDIGVNRASLGVQDFSPHVQREIGRVQPFAVVERAVELLRGIGIDRINIDLMYGLPHQSARDIERTIMLAHSLAPQRYAVFGYAHVPWFKPHQRLIDTAALPSPETRLAQAACAHEALTGLGYRPIGLDHYARQDDDLARAAAEGRLRRNFQGYTTDDADALIGLGASAIGRLPQGFVQNAADTAGYKRAVAAGRFATVRGLALSADDRLRGRVIEELMCNLACDLDQLAGETGERAGRSWTPEYEALAPFVEKGYVRIDGNRIAVEEDARPYLRLIAASFDAYLEGSRARHSVAV